METLPDTFGIKKKCWNYGEWEIWLLKEKSNFQNFSNAKNYAPFPLVIYVLTEIIHELNKCKNNLLGIETTQKLNMPL